MSKRKQLSWVRRQRLNTAASGLLLTLLVVALDRGEMLLPVESWLYDRRARDCQFFTRKPSDKIVHFDIDDASLEAIGQWPWPRSVVGDIVEEINRGGPKVIALDILFGERQKPEWVKQPKGSDPPFVRVDHDLMLARSFQRVGTVLLGNSLPIGVKEPQDAILDAAVPLLRENLELSAADVAKVLAKLPGMREVALTETDGVFLAARREAARQRVMAELDRDPSLLPGSSAPAGAPATSPASQPSQEDDEVSPQLWRLRRRLIKGDVSIGTPVRVVIDGAYERALAERELKRQSFIVPGMPALYTVAPKIVTVRELAAAAAGSGFVEYPVFGDGKVRSVPMLIEYNGRVYPQFGLAIAAKMAGGDLAHMRYVSGNVVIPRKNGPSGDGQLVIPVRTHVPPGGGEPIPMVLDIPWVGKDWLKMYGEDRHFSLARVQQIREAIRGITKNNLEVDHALKALLFDSPDSDPGDPYFLGVNDARAKDYFTARRDMSDWSAREQYVRDTLKQVRQDGLLDGVDLAHPPDPDAEPDPKEKRAARRQQTLTLAVNALEHALQQAPRLQKQINDDRQWLRDRVKDRAVLVGWYATAQVADKVATSLDAEAPGVSVHGVIANGILTGELWKTAPAWVTLLVTALAGAMTTLVVTRLPPAHALLASVALMAGYILFNGIVLFDYGNTILGVAGPMTAIGAVWAGGTLSRLGIERKERERVRRLFGNYVDPDLIEFGLETDDESVFRGAERDMTVVFTDLKGFTPLSEALGRKIIPLLNEFMGRATTVIKRHRGFVNKFLGDGVMFFFNAPRNNPEYARDAIEAVLDLQKMVAEFTAELVAQGLPELALRAGVTTGEMVVGNAGSEERSDYTVLGNLVNLAARLESANKAMGTSNLMIDRTVELGGKGFLVRPVGKLCVVGLSEGVMTYEAVCREADATEEKRRLVEMSREVVNAFLDARPADCLEAVTKMEEALGESKFTQVYREKCERYLKAADPGEFECQIVLTEK